MRWYLLLAYLVLFSTCKHKQSTEFPFLSDKNIDSQISHDLSLPAWGPYTKKYNGISHIPDVEKGIRFDLSVIPTLYNQNSVAPDVFKKTNFHPWEASPGLEYFSFRYDLLNQDDVYSEVSYSEIDEKSRLIKMEFVNDTGENKEISAHLISSVYFPPLAPHKPEERILKKTIQMPEGAVWVEALDYQSFHYAHQGHRDELNYDGLLRGEVRENGLISSGAVEIGKWKGDKVNYVVEIPEDKDSLYLSLRYRISEDKKAGITIKTETEYSLKLPPSEDYRIETIPVGVSGARKMNIEISAKSGGNSIFIDGFMLSGQNENDNIKIEDLEWNPVPEVVETPELPNSLILKYENIDQYYGIYWESPSFNSVDFNSKDLPEDFNLLTTNQEETENPDKNTNYFKDIIIGPLSLNSNSSKSVFAQVTSGSLEEVKAKIKNAADMDYEKTINNARIHLKNHDIIPEGEKYLLSQQLMEATLLTNVVYPIYTQNQYIRHSTPGRKWDCLYTWDGGFIGIGFSELDLNRSKENLNAYLSTPEEQNAFIQHGTVLPVQAYEFQQIYNKDPAPDYLEEQYPKLKKYYDFLIGKTKTSTTRNLKSGLMRPWDYFYNSGGWDDYPVQQYVHENNMTKTVAPVVSTAHLIRFAKIMKQASRQLHLKDDYNGYENDIEELTRALNQYSWDEDSGYYSYVVHDKSGSPKHQLMYDDETNYNMGLGGVSPLVAGISSPEQIQKMMDNLTSEDKLWTSYGLSTVDRSAPYYNPEGYWNGRIWLPHQWFFWKAMLDMGQDEFAHKIAITALDLWKKEADATYNCYENFKIETGKGDGWYQFGGLSAPVLSWFAAYFEMGTFTTGFDVGLIEKEFNSDFSEFETKFRLPEADHQNFSVLVVMNPEFSYEVSWNGKKIAHKEFNKGVLSITLNKDSELGSLIIKKQ